jgi:hypothetical protein
MSDSREVWRSIVFFSLLCADLLYFFFLHPLF